jgi:hypothetical protein
MFMQPRSTDEKSKKRVKEDPLPYLFPNVVFNIVREQLIWSVLDNDGSNPLNAYSQPISVKKNIDGKLVSCTLYFHELLKSFINHKINENCWFSEITALKQVKQKGRMSIKDSYQQDTVKVVYIPTQQDLEGQGYNKEQVSSMMEFSLFLQNVLLCIPGDCDLILANDIGVTGLDNNREPYEVKNLATVNNIMKVSRLEEKLGYHKYMPRGDMVESVKNFYRAEKKRMACVQGKVRVTDSGLRDLSEVDRNAYNDKIFETISKNPRITAYGNVELSRAVASSSSVNPANARIYDVMTMQRANKQKVTSSKTKYREMIEEYFALSGYRLIIKEEMQNKSLAKRQREIMWASNLSQQQPTMLFLYNKKEDNLLAINGVIDNSQHARDNTVSVSDDNKQVKKNPMLYGDPRIVKKVIPGQLSQPVNKTKSSQQPQLQQHLPRFQQTQQSQQQQWSQVQRQPQSHQQVIQTSSNIATNRFGSTVQPTVKQAADNGAVTFIDTLQPRHDINVRRDEFNNDHEHNEDDEDDDDEIPIGDDGYDDTPVHDAGNDLKDNRSNVNADSAHNADESSEGFNQQDVQQDAQPVA